MAHAKKMFQAHENIVMDIRISLLHRHNYHNITKYDQLNQSHATIDQLKIKLP